MNKNLAIIFLALSSVILQGCNNLKKTNQPADVATPAEDKSQSQLSFLKECLNNANELANLDKKYKPRYDEIHALITETKAYSSFADKTSENVTRVVTPLFEYKINYKCSNISHLLIEEFNKRAQKTENPGGGKS